MMKWFKARLQISRRQLWTLLALSIITSLMAFLVAKHYGINDSRITEVLSSLPRVTSLATKLPSISGPSGIVSHESFAVVMLDTYVYPYACIDEIDECPIVEPSSISSKGSGVVVGHGTGVSYVMTAAHVCQHTEYPGVLIYGMPYAYDYFSETAVVDFAGKIREATVIDVDEENDLCLLMARGVWAEPIPIADVKPKHGERVLNMAAPLGIFSPGMVLTFDGLYSGDDILGDSFFTIPAWPGSSGSPVINTDGEIVSIIHSATPMFPNIALGANLTDIQRLMAENDDLLR